MADSTRYKHTKGAHNAYIPEGKQANMHPKGARQIPSPLITATMHSSPSHQSACNGVNPSASLGICYTNKGKQEYMAKPRWPDYSKVIKARHWALSLMHDKDGQSYKTWCHHPPVTI